MNSRSVWVEILTFLLLQHLDHGADHTTVVKHLRYIKNGYKYYGQFMNIFCLFFERGNLSIVKIYIYFF